MRRFFARRSTSQRKPLPLRGDLLVEEIDAEGGACHYQYDGAGRKIAEHKYGTTLTYTYDAMGRLRTKHGEDHSQEFSYDLLGQITSERTFAPDGRLLKEESYVYDGKATAPRCTEEIASSIFSTIASTALLPRSILRNSNPLLL